MASVHTTQNSALNLNSSSVMPSHPYTCNSCQVAFRSSDLQRGHMRSDWHRFNLKRRVASLPPISSETFTEKVLQANVSITAAAGKAAFEKTCSICTRTYFSHNAYQNHLGSQKHKSNLASQGYKDIETHSVMSTTFSLGDPENATEHVLSREDDQIIDIVEAVGKATLNVRSSTPPSKLQSQRSSENKVHMLDTSSATAEDYNSTNQIAMERCLFCNLVSESLELCINHMEKIHGMFIPEKSFLVNVNGLISSLHRKIFEYHECLYCGKLKPSIFGLQTHMRDKGHCMIPFFTEEEQLEIGEFYDFSSTYSDGEDMSDSEESSPEDILPRATKLKTKQYIKVESAVYNDLEQDDEGWETGSSTSSLDSVATVTVSSHLDKSSRAVLHTEYELYLPSGRTAGHRSMNKYYRQNLHNYLSPAEKQEQLAIEATVSSYDGDQTGTVANRSERGRGRTPTSRPNRELGMIGVSEHKRKEIVALEKRTRRLEQRGRRRNEWLINKQNNSQKHFRDPLLQ